MGFTPAWAASRSSKAGFYRSNFHEIRNVAISNDDHETEFRAGYVALIGRPNAGKSTLLNRLVGEKIAAVSNKPQTTRFKILGVVTRPEAQIVLVDTPGVHKPGYELNRRMMAAVHDALIWLSNQTSRRCCC